MYSCGRILRASQKETWGSRDEMILCKDAYYTKEGEGVYRVICMTHYPYRTWLWKPLDCVIISLEEANNVGIRKDREEKRADRREATFNREIWRRTMNYPIEPSENFPSEVERRDLRDK